MVSGANSKFYLKHDMSHIGELKFRIYLFQNILYLILIWQRHECIVIILLCEYVKRLPLINMVPFKKFVILACTRLCIFLKSKVQ